MAVSPALAPEPLLTVSFCGFRGRGMPKYSLPEWICFHCYRGHLGMIQSLDILLYDMVCGDPPVDNNEDIIQAGCSSPYRSLGSASTSPRENILTLTVSLKKGG